MLDVHVIEDPEAAAIALDPIRAAMLAALREPASATTLSERLDMTRQKANYHLRQLEAHGLVELVEERPRRGLKERVVVASANSYALSPTVLGESASSPERMDRLSTRYLIAVAAEIVRDVAELSRRADQANKPLSTLTIETDVCFASAADRAEFTDKLADAVTTLAARYHDDRRPSGRWHRIVLAAHPRLSKGTQP